MSIKQVLRGDIPIINIDTPLCKACISILGGQLLSWQPKGFDEVMYLSPSAVFKVGTAIRGGAPICWPWFADAGTPKHGFARDRLWEVSKTEVLPSGSAHICLNLKADDHDGIKAEIDTVIGDKLTQTLTTTNGSKPIDLSIAIHNYWAVADVTKVNVTGLENIKFTEKASGVKPHPENPLQIDGPIDRIYHDIEGPITLHDPVLGRKITLERNASRNVIVWNCWADDAKKMSDMPDDGYMKYLCMETGNVLTNSIHLNPNETNVVSYTATVSK